jgi:hypothetical protein
MSTVDSALLGAYQAADYVVLDDPPIVFQIGVEHQGLSLLLLSFGAESASFLTAWNPRSGPLSADENLDRQMRLLDLIESERLNYFVGRGESSDGNWAEDSYLIFDLDPKTAMEWARAFEQNAWVWVPALGAAELVITEY